MAEVVTGVVVTCPSCGCQAGNYPNDPPQCEQPRPYFDAMRRTCQKIDTHGANPQTH